MKGLGMRSWVGAAALLLVAMFASVPATAADQFSCRASLVRVSGEGPLADVSVEPVVANDQGDPCVAEAKGILDALGVADAPAPFGGDTYELPGELGMIQILYAETATQAGSSASARSGVAQVLLTVPGAPPVAAEVLTSRASATCEGGTPTFDSSSQVLGLKIGDDAPVDVSEHQHVIDLGEVVLHVNEKTTTPTSVTQQALFLDTPLVDVVIAESVADFSGDPCGGAPVPQCRDGIDNDGDGLTDFAGGDPGCSSPDDDDETNAAPVPQCRDGIDNDGDGFTDFAGGDPGCSSPDDDDETNAPTTTQCSDGIDNDGDGFTDFPQDPGCSSPQDNDETGPPPLNGYLTGGGTIDDPSEATHGFSLSCTADDAQHSSFTVQWDTGDFHLHVLEATLCYDDPNLEPKPVHAGFDTLQGRGSGTCLGEPATAFWRLTDGGEPGTRDHAHIEIDGVSPECDLVADGFLVKGNQQAHPA
jgi:hypothetical protein